MLKRSAGSTTRLIFSVNPVYAAVTHCSSQKKHENNNIARAACMATALKCVVNSGGETRRQLSAASAVVVERSL
jgi:hypothetical protein